MSGLTQKINDHTESDREQFAEIKEGQKVIQEDIKEILRNVKH